jgi:hypothetical protein
MKKYLLLIILLSSQFLFAQSKKQFSTEIEKFEPELEQFLKNKNGNGKAMADTFIVKYNSYSDGSKKSVINLLNTLRKTRLKKIEIYDQVLQSIILIDSLEKDNGANIDSWLSSYNKFIANKKATTSQKQKFIEANYNVLAHSRLNPKSRKIKWGTSGTLVYNSKDVIKYSIKGSDLYCTSGLDSMGIAEVEASFLPSKQVIEIAKAKIYWDSNTFSKDSLYVVAKNISIDVKQKGFVADSVVLHSKYFFKKEVLGSIEERVETRIVKKKVYPIFKSYMKNYFVKNITPDVNFSGGIVLRKNTLYGVGDNKRKAVLHCTYDNKEVFLFNSKSFVFGKKNIFSGETSVSIRLQEDSIFHPEMSMNYDIKQAKLLVSKNRNKLSESPFSNSFNSFDMFLKSLSWKRGNKEIVFETEKYIDVPFVSNNYYERDVFRQFQGLNNVNPLVQLYDVYMYSEDSDNLTINYIARQMGMPKQYATHMLMELAILGYVYVDLDLGRVSLNEKFFNIVEVYKGNKDYDVILFHAPDATSINGLINLENGKISLVNIDRINLSTNKKVYVFPSDTVVVNKDLNLRFNGEVNVGNYEFHGSDYTFEYEDFKVVMNGNQKMQYYVPNWKRDSNGKFQYVKVFNPIDSLRGELYIDEPTNKSGRIAYDDYPKFNNTRDAYVFYDLPQIRNGVYSRDQLYVKLAPFELDSLTTVSSRDVKFYGTIHTGNIFPDFEYFVNVQKDFSLGFLYDTEVEGLEIFKKGIYKDELSLNMEGLNGRGRLSYLSSEIESEQVEFYSDSLKMVAQTFDVDYKVIDTLNTPLGSGENVAVFWEPEIDSMSISMLEKPFVFYDSTVSLNGHLAFLKNDLIASGNVLFETAEISSGYYNFYADSINSRLLDFKLKETMDSPAEVEIINSAGVVDMTNRESRFMLLDKNAHISFITSKYNAYIDSVVWKMDNNRIELTSTNVAKMPWFVSVDPAQDSLRFQAAQASYNLTDDKLEISKVVGIAVADAFINPEDDKLEILENGWMQGFEHAKIKMGIGAHEHTLENANIVINSSKSFVGDAEYYYKDIDSINHTIVMSSIYVDSIQGKTIGKGDILADEEFMLNPYFSFNGQVEVSGRNKFLRFQGYSGIQNYCDDIDVGEVPIEGVVDPNNVKVEINNFDNSNKYSFIYNGIYATLSNYSAAFLSTDRDLVNYDFISAKGSFYYDEPEACYAIGGDKINGVKQDEVRFYNDECRLGASGEIKFYNPDKLIEIKAYGNIDFDMNAEIMTIQTVLGLNFEFSRLIMDEIRQALQETGAKDVLEDESKIKELGFSRLMNKSYSANYDGLGNFGQGLPKDLQFGILFSNLELSWDANEKMFLSGDEIGIHSFNGHLINKIFNGKVEIKKRRGGDEITIYFATEEGKYYYFSYRSNVMNFHTNNRKVMDKFDEIDDKDRVKEINGVEYRFKKASRLNVRSFQNRYM